MAEFFLSRQKNLIFKGYKNDLTDFVIDQHQLKNNLFYKAVINEIMSGKIYLIDQQVSSQDIIDNISEYIKIFLFHESKFLNNNFEYQGEAKSKDKLISLIGKTFISDLYPMNEDNYHAIKLWKNENFLKLIRVVKDNIQLNDCPGNNEQSNIEKLEAKEQLELAKMIWESNIVYLVFDHLSLEGYFNSLQEMPLLAQESCVD